MRRCPGRVLLFLVCLFSLSFGSSQVRSPRNLGEAISYFQQIWTKAELDSFKNRPEHEAVSGSHFGVGLWIRNNWVRGDRDTALRNYFESLGVYDPDDISSIIMTSLHRVLNNQDISVGKQVKRCMAGWKVIHDCEKKERDLALSKYAKFKVGDSVNIIMPVDTEGGERNAVYYECATTGWTFNKKKDLVLKGVVMKKYFINDTANLFFSVRIEYLSRKDTKILMEQVREGGTFEFPLAWLTIE